MSSNIVADEAQVTADDFAVAATIQERAAEGNLVTVIHDHAAAAGEDFADTFARLARVVAAEIREGRLSPR